MPVFQYTDQEAENLINNVYLGNVNPNNLPLDLYLAINLYLSSAVDTVFGAESMLEIGAPDYELTRYYKHNIALFSGAKTYQQAKDMSEQLFTADGMKREFSAFRRDADEIFNTYNKNWLRTEYDTAIGQAQTGSLWLDIERDKEALPYLRYITAGDERVRQEHKAWDGITLPVNHPFWDNHMPLNGWNCRCNVMQLSEFEATGVTSDDDLKDLPEPEELFKGNPAKTKELFDKKHPYFVVPAKDKERLKNNFGFPTPNKPEKKAEIKKKIIPERKKDLRSLNSLLGTENNVKLEGVDDVVIKSLNEEYRKAINIGLLKKGDVFDVEYINPVTNSDVDFDLAVDQTVIKLGKGAKSVRFSQIAMRDTKTLYDKPYYSIFKAFKSGDYTLRQKVDLTRKHGVAHELGHVGFEYMRVLGISENKKLKSLRNKWIKLSDANKFKGADSVFPSGYPQMYIDKTVQANENFAEVYALYHLGMESLLDPTVKELFEEILKEMKKR